MHNRLEQSQNLLLKQTLSLKQIQYLKLLAMNVTELGDYLNSLYTENPVVDLSMPNEAQTKSHDDNIELFSWLNKGSEPFQNNYSEDEPSEIIPKGQIQDDRLNLISHIRSQFDFSLRDFDISLLEILLGSLDKKGYLVINEDSVAKKGYDRELVDEAISYLQSLDPCGIGARNLSECLSIQMRRNGETDEDAFKMIDFYLEDLSRGYFQKVAKALGCDVGKVTDIYKKIKKLNPIPASGFGSESAYTFIIPDVSVFPSEDGLCIKYNNSYQPKISINQSYLGLASKNSETKDYINKKMQQALWVMKAVDSRRNTIERIVGCIVETQLEFFEGGSSLSPLKLKDIATRLSIHESTVSRAINEKYLECKKGIFPLKYFFSGEVSQSGDEGDVSSENPKSPYSDSEIIKILESEGIMIARRTVAKYRSLLGIESSSVRKQR